MKYECYIGIDQSLNSSGICEKFYLVDGKHYEKVWEHFDLIIHESSISKKKLDSLIKENNDDVFNIRIYDRKNPNVYKTDLSKFEETRINNIHNISTTIQKTLCEVLGKFENKIGNVEDTFVTIENVAINGVSSTLNELFGLNYVIRNDLTFGCKIKSLKNVISVAPTANKRFACGRGDADKELIVYCFKIMCKDDVISRIEQYTKIDDIADAYFMSDYGLFYEKNIRLLPKKINAENTRSNKKTKKQKDAEKNMFDENMKNYIDVI